MIVYLDIFLIENTILNLIIFVSVSIILKAKINFFRILIVSFFGSIYSFWEYYLEVNNVFFKGTIKILCSIILVFCAYKGNIKKKIKLWIIFIFVSLIYGGISYFVQIFFRPNDLILYNDKGKSVVGIFPIKTVIMGFCLGFIIIYVVAKIFNKKLNIDNLICDIEININTKSVKTKALVDSGNFLKDPITKKDVIIVEEKVLKNILESSYINVLKNVVSGKFIGQIDTDKYKIKIIPFNSLGNPNGILCGINPDYIKVYYEEEIILNNVIIGVYFSSLNSSSEYSSIIGLGCLKEEII